MVTNVVQGYPDSIYYNACGNKIHMLPVYEELVSRVVDLLGNNLHQIILFGSVARGEADIDSDIDIAIIAMQWDDTLKLAMIDIMTDLEIKYDIYLSFIMLCYDYYIKYNNHSEFLYNIKKEGIILWKNLY